MSGGGEIAARENDVVFGSPLPTATRLLEPDRRRAGDPARRPGTATRCPPRPTWHSPTTTHRWNAVARHTEHNALTSLRAAVMRTQRRAPGLLAAGRTTLGLDPAVQVDVHDLVRDSVDDVVPAVGAGPWLPSLLSGEELLPGWYDDWMIFERERLQQVRLRRLEALARRAIEDGDAPLALEATRLAVRIEPLLESVRALRIRAHLCAGDQTGAVREFHEYRFQVAHELDVSPSPALMELVRPLVARPAGTRNTDASSDDGNSTVQATVPAARAKGVAQGHSRLPPSR